MTFPSSNPVYAAGLDAWDRLQEWRAGLGLKAPGTVEGLTREVSRDVFLSNYAFTGLRADVTKALSLANPTFQLSHAISMGSAMMPPYTFSAVYGTEAAFLSANMDSDAQMSARANYRWTPGFVTKVQGQLGGGGPNAMVQIEQDYQGPDLSANLKCVNPSILDGGQLTGIFVANYLQSVTPTLALGVEGMYQRTSPAAGPDAGLSYVARYTRGSWIATAQAQSRGLQATFWKRLSERVEAGAECNISLTPAGPPGVMGGGGLQREASTTIGMKYEFRQSVFRGQVDGAGKVSCLLERRLNPAVTWTMAADLDHAKVCSLSLSLPANKTEVGQDWDGHYDRCTERRRGAAAAGASLPADDGLPPCVDMHVYTIERLSSSLARLACPERGKSVDDSATGSPPLLVTLLVTQKPLLSSLPTISGTDNEQLLMILPGICSSVLLPLSSPYVLVYVLYVSFPRQSAHLDIRQPSMNHSFQGLRMGEVIKETVHDGATGEQWDLSYTQCKIVGNGSFGVVFQTKLVGSGEDAAIKRVLQDKRFKNRELQIMRKVQHPNIVQLKAFFYSSGDRRDEVFLNLVLEYVPETVYRASRHFTKLKTQMPILEVKLYIYQLFRSLAYIHSQGICHRDIKPQNLLLDPATGVLKLCDFGSAKMLVAGEPNVSYICSRYYRAPELIFGATNYTTKIGRETRSRLLT